MSEIAKNMWWAFVKAHKKDVDHIKDRKERFQALSEMWKNEKASMITVHADYLLSLHNTNSSLKGDLENMRLENMQLKEMLRIMTEAK